MKKWILIIVGILFFPSLLGCQTVNEAVRGPSEAVGGALAVPQAITQGVNSGYTDQTGTTQSNPYGR